jgi:hypothetical protein
MYTAVLILALLGAQADENLVNQAKTKAQTLLSEGTQFFNRGAMAEALDKFKEAYAEFASPKLLFNIGLTSRNLGRTVEAMGALEQFLEEATDAPPDMVVQAKQSVDELRGLLGNLTIKCSVPGPELALDGRPLGFAPLPKSLWVMPGSHLVTAKHPEFSLTTVTVDVNAGTVHTVTLPMQRLAPEEPVASLAPAPTSIANPKVDAGLASSSDVSAPSKGWWLGRKWTWVAASSTVVLAGSAVAFGLSMQSKYDSLNRRCGSASPNYEGCNSGDIGSVTWRRNAANVLWGLSAAAGVTAGVLFMVEGHNVAVAPVAGDATGLLARVTY